MQTHVSPRRAAFAFLCMDAVELSTPELLGQLRLPMERFSMGEAMRRNALMRALSYRLRCEYSDDQYRLHKHILRRELLN